jgi:hypothetical protein
MVSLRQGLTIIFYTKLLRLVSFCHGTVILIPLRQRINTNRYICEIKRTIYKANLLITLIGLAHDGEA